MIEAVSAATLEEILPLVRAYLEFYKVEDINEDRNRQFFSRFGEDSAAGCQFVYRNSAKQAVGFATLYFTYVSSITAKVGVMNDLFTLPAYRGRGIGRELTEHCLEYAKAKGAARLQWLTAPDNRPAQALYDSLNTQSSDWKVYTLS